MRCIEEPAALSPLDKLAMLVAGVVHDVDHMGLNNRCVRVSADICVDGGTIRDGGVISHL